MHKVKPMPDLRPCAVISGRTTHRKPDEQTNRNNNINDLRLNSVRLVPY
jgi:hypothetical protein